MALDADDFAFIQRFLHEQSGVALEADKAYLVDARLTPVAHRQGFASLADFIAHLRLQASTAHRMQAGRPGHS